MSVMLAAMSASGSAVPVELIGLDDATLDAIHTRTESALPSAVRVGPSDDELAKLRVEGIDLEFVRGSLKRTFESSELRGTETVVPETVIPSFDVANASGSAIDVGLLSANTQVASGGVRFTIDRNTVLSDGGISGSYGVLNNENPVASISQGEGEYNLTDLEMQWRASQNGPLQWSIVSGITTIEADVNKSVNQGGSSEVLEVHKRVAFVPTVGSELRWEINEDWSITSQALTQSVDIGSSLVDFSTKADWRLSDTVGLSAGYQIIRSSFDVGSVSSDLSQEGLFARVQIRF